jgi:hypothetical protein
VNLRDYPTLQSVIEFVHKNAARFGRRGASQPAGPEPAVRQSHRPNDLRILAISNRAVDRSRWSRKSSTVVSEKTGYPTEMLELDQDMEADLGIDTVKQAETFASIRESFGIPVQEGCEPARLPHAAKRD